MTDSKYKKLAYRQEKIMRAIDGLNLEDAYTVLSSSMANTLVYALHKGLSAESAYYLVDATEQGLKQLIDDRSEEINKPPFEMNQ